jgi:hypothetical protein
MAVLCHDTQEAATRYALGRRQGITEDLVATLSDYERGPFTDREALGKVILVVRLPYGAETCTDPSHAR